MGRVLLFHVEQFETGVTAGDSLAVRLQVICSTWNAPETGLTPTYHPLRLLLRASLTCRPNSQRSS
jgi:hypothetical protein